MGSSIIALSLYYRVQLVHKVHKDQLVILGHQEVLVHRVQLVPLDHLELLDLQVE